MTGPASPAPSTAAESMSAESMSAESRRPSCLSCAVAGMTAGALGGLVSGIIYGIIQEKLFVFRNVVKDYHLREPPIRLFSVLHRGITTVPVAAVFLGLWSGSRCVWQHRLEPSSPVHAGVAASGAGAMRTVLGEVAMHPLIHLQKSLGLKTWLQGLHAGMADFQEADQGLRAAAPAGPPEVPPWCCVFAAAAQSAGAAAAGLLFFIQTLEEGHKEELQQLRASRRGRQAAGWSEQDGAGGQATAEAVAAGGPEGG